MTQLKNRQSKINQPSTSTDRSLIVFTDTTGLNIESTGVLVDSTDATTLESVELSNCTFGVVSNSHSELTSGATVSAVYQTLGSNSWGLTLDRDITLNCDISAVNSAAEINIKLVVTRDSGATARTLTIANDNGTVDWGTTAPDFSDLGADELATVYLSIENGVNSVIKANRVI